MSFKGLPPILSLRRGPAASKGEAARRNLKVAEGCDPCRLACLCPICLHVHAAYVQVSVSRWVPLEVIECSGQWEMPSPCCSAVSPVGCLGQQFGAGPLFRRYSIFVRLAAGILERHLQWACMLSEGACLAMGLPFLAFKGPWLPPDPQGASKGRLEVVDSLHSLHTCP